MPGKNFPTSEEEVLVPTYYLDIDGLAEFWAKAKQYINNQNLSLNGQNIPLYPRGTESNKSISTAIEDLNNTMRVTIEYSDGTLNMSNVNEIDYNSGTLNLTL